MEGVDGPVVKEDDAPWLCLPSGTSQPTDHNPDVVVSTLR